MTAQSEYIVVLLDVLWIWTQPNESTRGALWCFWCALWQQWDTKHSAFMHPFQKFVSAFHPICQRQSVSRVWSCVFRFWIVSSNKFLFLFPFQAWPQTHTCTQPSTCMYKSHHHNAQGQSKDFFITCKHCDTDTNQGVYTTTKTRWKSLPCPFIKAHGETQCKSDKDELQQCAIQHKDIQLHPHTHKQTHIFLPRVDRLAAYWSTGSAWYEAKTCLKYFTPI